MQNYLTQLFNRWLDSDDFVKDFGTRKNLAEKMGISRNYLSNAANGGDGKKVSISMLTKVNELYDTDKPYWLLKHDPNISITDYVNLNFDSNNSNTIVAELAKLNKKIDAINSKKGL